MLNKILSTSSADNKRAMREMIGKLEAAMKEHRLQMNALEKEVLGIIKDYRKALDKERLRKLRSSLS